MSQHLFVSLTPQQRQELLQQVRTGIHPARVLTRARILLLADRSQSERRTHKQIAQAVQVCELTVGNICRRFVLAQRAGQDGLDAALTEKPRPGKVPKITGQIEAHLVLLACSQPPAGCARWTMQLLPDVPAGPCNCWQTNSSNSNSSKASRTRRSVNGSKKRD
jgi:putative transposase